MKNVIYELSPFILVQMKIETLCFLSTEFTFNFVSFFYSTSRSISFVVTFQFISIECISIFVFDLKTTKTMVMCNVSRYFLLNLYKKKKQFL